MGRLTDRDKHKQGIWVDEQNGLYDFHKLVEPSDVLYPAINKLAHYEDLEEQGRLIELPCALYDVVWSIQPFKVVRSDSIGSFGYSEDGLEMWDWNGEWIGIFGKTAFLTKEEAEAKLKELEG